MPRFSEDFIEKVSEANPIDSVVGKYVTLSKRSGSNYFGLCPFHNEKTPSFSVCPSKGIYHCFGCGKGGGVFNFIMDIESLSFPEAVEFLAEEAHIPVPARPDDESDLSEKRRRLLKLNRDAAVFFNKQLTPGSAGAAYVQRRAISKAYVTRFGLGFAPDSFDSLIKAMRSLGYSDSEMLEAGLVKKSQKSSGCYDVFRNRLIFPVIDVKGNVLGFSGRDLGDRGPKYLNTADTVVFTKGKNLFAMNLAKKTSAGYVILVEGNVDVVSLHQAGFDSAVAALGTALTDDQARLISRYVDRVVLAYDNDAAGAKATERAIGIFSRLDVEVKVLRISGAKDPDEFIQRYGADAFRRLIEDSESQLDFRLANIRSGYNLEEPSQKAAYVKSCAALLADVPSRVEREVYASRVAEISGISYQTVLSEIESVRRKHARAAEKKDFKQSLQVEKTNASPVKGLRYENVTSAKAEEGVIRILCQDPGAARNVSLPSPDSFSSPELSRIYSLICERLKGGSDVSIARLSNALEPVEMNILSYIIDVPEQLTASESTLRAYIDVINKQKSENAPPDLAELAKILRENGKGIG